MNKPTGEDVAFRRSHMIKFNCPHCGTRISAGAEDAGRQAPCPSCGSDIVVPDAAESLPAAPKLPPPLPQPALSRSKGANDSSPRSTIIQSWFPTVSAYFRKPGVRAFFADRRQGAILVGVGLVVYFFILFCASLIPSSPAPSVPPTASAEEQVQTWANQLDGEFRKQKGSPCRICNGTGRNSKMSQCRTCYGRGTLTTPSGYAMICQDCAGRGLRYETCGTCSGSGKFTYP